MGFTDETPIQWALKSSKVTCNPFRPSQQKCEHRILLRTSGTFESTPLDHLGQHFSISEREFQLSSFKGLGE